MKIPRYLKARGYRSARRAYIKLGKARGALRWWVIGKKR